MPGDVFYSSSRANRVALVRCGEEDPLMMMVMLINGVIGLKEFRMVIRHGGFDKVANMDSRGRFRLIRSEN